MVVSDHSAAFDERRRSHESIIVEKWANRRPEELMEQFVCEC
jgi:hypothetical protein